MQVTHQTQPSLKPMLGTQSPSMLPSRSAVSAVSQKIYNQDVLAGKSENENYNFQRLYSPFLSPSNAVVADKVNAAKSLEQKYVHNEARTKYFFISKPAKSNDHLKVNLLA
mgnify:CR=1 FL=1